MDTRSLADIDMPASAPAGSFAPGLPDKVASRIDPTFEST